MSIPAAPTPAAAAIAAAAAAPAELTPVEAVPAPVEVKPEPGPAPWAKTLETSFADEAERSRVDAYLREHHQPYVTKVEQERAAALAQAEELEGKAWVFDDLNADPAAALKDIASKIYGDDAGERIAERIAELVAGGVDATVATEVAEAEEFKLPAEVEDTVKWAKAEQARRAAEDTAAKEAEAMTEATAALEAWTASTLAANPDIKKNALYAYVASNGGDMDGALAAYRADFPAPAKAPAPTVLAGGGGGPVVHESGRRHSSLASAAGAVFDAARGA